MSFFKQAERFGVGWRVAAVVGPVAVVAAVLAGYAALTHHSLTPGSTPGLVAAGKIGNTPWQITFTPSAKQGQHPGSMCIVAAVGAFAPGTCGTFPPPGPTHPAWFYDSAIESSQVQVQYALGGVDADVTSVVLRLRDGQQLKLIPVSRYGQRLVAYVIPMQAGIAGATVYLENGQYATATGVPPTPKKSGLPWTLTPWVWHAPGGT